MACGERATELGHVARETEGLARCRGPGWGILRSGRMILTTETESNRNDGNRTMEKERNKRVPIMEMDHGGSSSYHDKTASPINLIVRSDRRTPCWFLESETLSLAINREGWAAL